MKSIRSQDSTIKNKLDELANQAIAILLEFLCIFQKLTFSDDTTRLRFRCLHVFIILTYPVMNHLCMSILIIHEKTLSSYNDDSFFLERYSHRRSHEWIVQDSYPQASLEVFHNHLSAIIFTICAGVSERNTLAKSLFRPKSSVKYLPLDITDMSTACGTRKTEKYGFPFMPLADRTRSTWWAFIKIEYMSPPLNFHLSISNGSRMIGFLPGNI